MDTSTIALESGKLNFCGSVCTISIYSQSSHVA